MPEPESAEDRLARLREVILSARSMPMSASCVVNRADVLAAIDAVIDVLPNEIAAAQEVIDQTQATLAEGEAKAARLVAEAQDQAARLAEQSEVVRVAEEQAAALIAEAEQEADALRREADVYIDSRLAGFESVLHKTLSQVRVARSRLAERSDTGSPTAH
jgi:hypothetical protein